MFNCITTLYYLSKYKFVSYDITTTKKTLIIFLENQSKGMSLRVCI